MSDIDPAWLTVALSAHHPGAVVARCSVGPVAAGTNRRARVTLDYSRESGPSSVFVKLHGRLLNRLALVALGALDTEARLAHGGVSFPLEHPKLYAGGADRRRLATVVVMADVTAGGGRPNDSTAPLHPDEVRHGLDGLAALHAAYWSHPRRAALDHLRPWRLGRKWAPVSAASLARGLRLMRAQGTAVDLPATVSAARLERQFRASATLAATGHQTVLHGDPHPGNTYALPGRRTGFYDWQLARTGHWSHDVGYFLVGSLAPGDRRRHERLLLRSYLDALAAAGADPPGWEEAWERYRATPAFGLATWVHTLAGGGFQPASVCLPTLSRFAAAYRDLDTAGSVVTRPAAAGRPGA